MAFFQFPLFPTFTQSPKKIKLFKLICNLLLELFWKLIRKKQWVDLKELIEKMIFHYDGAILFLMGLHSEIDFFLFQRINKKYIDGIILDVNGWRACCCCFWLVSFNSAPPPTPKSKMRVRRFRLFKFHTKIRPKTNLTIRKRSSNFWTQVPFFSIFDK